MMDPLAKSDEGWDEMFHPPGGRKTPQLGTIFATKWFKVKIAGDCQYKPATILQQPVVPTTLRLAKPLSLQHLCP